MSSDTKRHIDGRRELIDLVERFHVPQPDGLVLADGDDVLLEQVEVHAEDGVSVRPQESSVLLI
jgi:hypothetical protein